MSKNSEHSKLYEDDELAEVTFEACLQLPVTGSDVHANAGPFYLPIHGPYIVHVVLANYLQWLTASAKRGKLLSLYTGMAFNIPHTDVTPPQRAVVHKVFKMSLDPLAHDICAEVYISVPY
jgi:hypothetical protein